MIISKLWFRCAAGKDPVSPVIVKPAVIGWQAEKRVVDLTIQRSVTGEELLRRMQGWVTVDVEGARQVLKKHGELKILDSCELTVETETPEDDLRLRQELNDNFGNQLELEKIYESKPKMG